MKCENLMACAADDNGLSADCELPLFRRADGEVFPAETTCRQLDMGDRKIRLAVIRDVSNRLEIESALRESQKRFKLLTDFLPETIFESDQTGRVTFANKNAFEKFGYTEEDFENGLNGFDMIAPEDRPRAVMNAERIMRGEDIGPNQYMAVRKDGSRFPALMLSSPITQDGMLVGLRGLLIDISDLQKTRKALRRSEAKYEQLLRHAPAGICKLNLKDLRLIQVNDVICDYLGYTRQELLSMNLLDLFADESIEYLLERQAKILSEKQVHESAEYKLKVKDGRELWILANGRFFYENKKPVEATYVLHDITERKRLEAQLHQSQKMEAMGRLAGGVAHDFNNILTSMTVHVELLLAALSRDDPIRIHVEGVQKGSERAASLTKQLMAFSRKQIRHPRTLNLNTIIENLKEMLQRLIGEDIELVTALAPEGAYIEADLAQMEQLIVNLVVNGRDALPDGGSITIKTNRAKIEESLEVDYFEVKPGMYEVLSITDTGVGMDERTRSRIFEPFYTTKRLGQGTGLGLATVYGVVKQSGGYILVDSQIGRGTTFSIHLPGIDQPDEPRDDRPLPMGAKGGKETILVVEDDEEVLDLTTTGLRRLGYQVHAHENGEDALEFCTKHEGPIDLLLTDVVMTGMSGHKLAECVSSLCRGVRVLYMSGYPNDTIKHGVAQEGVQLLEKPFTIDVLAQKIRQVLSA